MTTTDYTWSFGMGMTAEELSNFPMPKCGEKYAGIWFGWRAFASLYFLAVAITSIVQDCEEGVGAWWLIYLTNWTLVLQIVYLHLSAWITRGYLLTKRTPKKVPTHYHIAWILQSVLASATTLVFLLYWALIHDGGAVKFVTINTHGVNFIAMLIDRGFSKQPARMMHFYYPMIYGIIFYLFSIMHEYAGLDNGHKDGTSIYSVTNYSQHPDRHGIAIVCLVVFVPFCYWGMVYWGQIVDCCCFAGDATSAKDDIELEEAVKEVKEEEI